MARLGVGAHRLSPPRLAPNVRPRARLLDRLDASSARVISVTAGAGYGKSTLLSAWAGTRAETCAWLQIEPADNDPSRLLRSVMCSLQAALPSTSLLGIAAEVQPETIGQALASLEAQVANTEPFAVVMDDVHVITDETASDVLDRMLDALPAHCQVVLSGRSDPPVHTARRLLDGELDVIRAEDLLLTDEESREVFAEIARQIPHHELQSLVQQIGGWAAGAQFVLLGLRHGDATQPAFEHQRISADLLTAYFQQEFLWALPPADRDFLLRTSFLDRLSGELCDAVLETSGSAERLEALVRSGNAFVIPAGRTGVFRYHPLFADMLLDELRSTETDRETELRQRAIEWFDARGERDAVVELALASDARIDPSPWIFKYILPLISRAEVASLGRWLGSFAPEDLRTNPLLALTAAWHALHMNRPDEMERWLETAGRLSYVGPLPDGTADISTAIAAVRMISASGGVLQTAANARIVRDAGAGAGPWGGIAVLLETVTLQVAGKLTDVRPMFELAEFETRGLPAAHATALAHLALDSMRRDDDQARDELRQAMDEIERNGLTQFRHVQLAYCALALAEARAGRFEPSLQASTHAENVFRDLDGVVRAHLHYRLILADAAIARNDWPTANRLVREAVALLPLEPDAAMLHEWADHLVQRCARRTTLATQVDLTPAERRVLEQLASHYTLGEIADHLYVSRNTIKTHTVSIYRKLLVSGRSEAVARASELGVLAGGSVERAVVTAR